MVRSAFSIYFNQDFKVQSTQTLVSSTMVCIILRICLIIAKIEKSCSSYTELFNARLVFTMAWLGNCAQQFLEICRTVKICPVKISAWVLLLPCKVILQEQSFLLGEEGRGILGESHGFQGEQWGSVVANRI